MRKKQSYQWSELELGACYYPEHWDRTLWREDLRRMREAGIGTVRVGEFAWSRFEPREGEFTFSFFDDFMNAVAETDMKVIFGTPTAAPPVWLTEKYPEVLNCRLDGTKYRHGMRRHYNYNSPVYQQLCGRIVEKLAAHYGSHPNVIGWQVDNELNCETAEFYSESDTLAFREFLKNRYGTLEELNRAWGTVFWSQEYTCWEEIYVPRPTIHDTTNPHQTLDYVRFVSDSAVRFCKLQSDILRKYLKPGDFITTNGMFGSLDNHRLTDETLDVYTYDSYPNFAWCFGEDPRHSSGLNDRGWSDHLAAVRSVCPHFGIMEQQSGANGWCTGAPAPAPKPGQMTLWAMQSIAHGADYVSFFRWRTCTMGTEIYWHGILDYDNRDNRKLEELKRLHRRTQAMKDIAGAEYKAAFGVLRDYSNVWDAQVDCWHRELAWKSEEEIFIASQLDHTPMDYVYLLEDTEAAELMKLPVLFYPHPLILSEKNAQLLKEYVSEGGCLIIGARAGLKDVNGKCVMTPVPGLLRELTGTEVTDSTFIGPGDSPVYLDLGGDRLDAGIFNEDLAVKAPRTEILETYATGCYRGEPALTEHCFGKGKVLHFGGTFTRGLVDSLLAYTGVRKPWEKVIRVPKECELCVREKDGQRWIFVLNYSDRKRVICLKDSALDVDTQKHVDGNVELKPYETKVYRI